MSSPSPVVRFFYALYGYSGVHWAAGRTRRALVWDALFVVCIALVFHVPAWLFVALHLAQAIDAALITPRRDLSDGEYAVRGLIAFTVLIAVTLCVRAFWAEAFKIPAGSMIPALQVGDHMWVDKTAHSPARGDVIVFKYPKEPDKDFVKRVVAVGGDTIEIRDDQLVVNDTPVPRARVAGPCEYQDYEEESGRWDTRRCLAWDETLDGRTYRVYQDENGTPRSFRPVRVPAGHYYVLGDNRDNSHDSRYWGFVPPDHVKGTARKIWWSWGPDGVRWDRLGKPIR